jgi:type VI secretion system secreted protein Hcp
VGPGTRIRRAWKAALILAVGLAGGGVAVAVAGVPNSGKVIDACYPITVNGQNQTVPVAPGQGTLQPYVRIIDPSAGQGCQTTANPPGGTPPEASLSWNVAGVTGPRGPTGAQGKSVTIAGGNVITIAGTAITVGSSHGVTIQTPPLTRRSKPIGTLTLDLASSRLSFEIFSWSFGASQGSSTGTGGGTGKSSVRDIAVTKKQDKASTKLFQLCATGTHIKSALLAVRKAGSGPVAYLKYTFHSVTISSYSVSSGGDRPSETISLNFTKIEYRPR